MGFRYFDLIKAPNSHFIGNSVDGFRSYMAAMYHIEHDSTYWHYGGMNYPYGDRVDFTDNIPLLTNSVKFISQNIVDVTPWFVGIWNVFLLVSLLLCGVFLFLIFRELELPLWYAIPISLGICFLSPQIVRMNYHFGLAHPFVIPMMIYLLLLFERKKDWQISMLIGALILMVYQIHFYLFAISIFMIGFYWLTKLIRNFSWPHLKMTLLHSSIQIFIPFVLLFLMLYLSDSILDRPEQPFGFLFYKSRLESIFFPLEYQPGRILKKLFRDELWWIEKEGIAYIGGVAVFFFGWTFFRRFRNYKTATLFPEAEPKHRNFMINLFASGLFLLLFALGFPFNLPGGAKLLEFTGPLQQFRSVGRFAWGFYYIINILAFYNLYHFIRKVDQKKWRIGFFVLAIAWLNFESVTYLNKKKLKLYPHPAKRYNFMDGHNKWLKKVDWKKYQAILPIPYFHIGSENVWLDAKGPVAYRSLWSSVRTGLPVISSFMGRTSLSQTKDFLAFIGEPYRPLKMTDALPNQQPILIFLQKANYKGKEERYQYLLDQCPKVYEDKFIELYELPIPLLEDRIHKKKNQIAVSIKDTTLHVFNDWLMLDSLVQFIHQDFNHIETTKNYGGQGAFSGKGNKENIIFEGPIPNQQADTLYQLALWMNIQNDLDARTWIRVEELNRSTSEIVQQRAFHIDRLIRCMDEDWALVEDTVRLKRPDSALRIIVGNENLGESPIHLDELQIRLKEAQLYRKEQKTIWWNNRRY